MAAAGVVEQVLIRRIYDADDRPALLYQRDIDSEFPVAFDEFACTVERVHQPVALPAAAYGVGHDRRFFRQYGELRRQGTQALFDHLMSGEVGFGQR